MRANGIDVYVDIIENERDGDAQSIDMLTPGQAIAVRNKHFSRVRGA